MDAIFSQMVQQKAVCVCVCVCSTENKKANVAKYSKLVNLCKGYIVVLCNFIKFFLKLEIISK